MRSGFVALMALSLAAAGCAAMPGPPLSAFSASSLTVRNSQDLYPLSKGLFWRYRTVSRSGDGPERNGPDQTSQVIASESTAGRVEAIVKRTSGDREYPPTRAIADARGVTLSRANRPEDGSITILRFPLEPGNSWMGRSWGEQAYETISVMGTESVTVPAGTFTATRTRHRIAYANGTEDLLHYWYAPGIGMVKAIEGLTVDLGQGPTLHQVTAELVEWGHR